VLSTVAATALTKARGAIVSDPTIWHFRVYSYKAAGMVARSSAASRRATESILLRRFVRSTAGRSTCP